MNKIVLSLLIIGTIMGIAGAGTWAYFSDTEQATGNTFTAGTLDLKMNGADSPSVANYIQANWKPGELRSNDISFTNAGSLNGNLNINVASITGIADTCSPLEFCNSAANLGGADFTVVIKDGETVLYSGLLSGISVSGINAGVLDAGALNTLTMQTTLNSGVGNDAQGDGISFNIVATLSQA